MPQIVKVEPAFESLHRKISLIEAEGPPSYTFLKFRRRIPWNIFSMLLITIRGLFLVKRYNSQLVYFFSK